MSEKKKSILNFGALDKGRCYAHVILFTLRITPHFGGGAKISFRQLWVELTSDPNRQQRVRSLQLRLPHWLTHLQSVQQLFQVVNKQNPPFWRLFFWEKNTTFFRQIDRRRQVFGFLLGQLSYFESWLVGSKDHTITTQTFKYCHWNILSKMTEKQEPQTSRPESGGKLNLSFEIMNE